MDREYSGMFGDPYSFWRYELSDETIYEEFLQADPWSSGPVFFLALQDTDGNPIEESLWAEEGIQENT